MEVSLYMADLQALRCIQKRFRWGGNDEVLAVDC
jgi:hypothetical protein